MNFCTLFLQTENVHLVKDVGQLPLSLKEDFGYDAYIATYQNGEYPYLKNTAKGLKLHFVKRSIWGSCIDGMRYIYKERKNIDILNIYHLNLSSFLWSTFFRKVRKRGAVVYLKLDANHLEIDKIKRKGIKAVIKRITIKKADIVSAESISIKEAMQKYCGTEILYIPNGYMQRQMALCPVAEKENLILTVGRLGSYQKATELLVDAFLNAGIAPEWKLALVGKATREFEEWIDSKLLEYPEERGNILIPGNIEDKALLMNWYSKAKIFVLPSRIESFGIVLIEALMTGCYVIASDAVLAAKDLLQGPEMGCIVGTNSEYELRKALQNIVKMDRDWDTNAYEIKNSIGNRFLWANILIPLNERIMNLFEDINE